VLVLDSPCVARVLICEPHDDISALLELVVRRLGHEPVPYGGSEPAGIDAAVIEPGAEDGLELARRLRADDIPVLFTSIYPAEHVMLELAPAAYLVKPFPLYALERELRSVLAPVVSAVAAAL
jgi:DNA-binding response OmpR family regulator